MATSNAAAERHRRLMIMDALSAIKRNNFDELKTLIETYGVPVDSVVDASGETLLMVAVIYGRTDMIRSLLSMGANVNMKDARGKTAVHKAVFLDHIETLKLLIEHGANVLEKDRDGYTPLDHARGAGSYQTSLFLHKYVKQLAQTKSRGRNLAALTTGLTKGTKENASGGTGLSNMHPEILERIGTYLTGKEGSLNEQRMKLRSNVGLASDKPAGGAGAPGRRRRHTRRRSRTYRK